VLMNGALLINSDPILRSRTMWPKNGGKQGQVYRAGEAGAQATAQSERIRP
jgi:hypothetical protein